MGVLDTTRLTIAAVLLLGSAGAALAALPVPALTPAQQEAAAAKKAEAAAQAALAKEKLTASMEAVSARWRSHAAAKGWAMHAPVAVAAAPAPGAPAAGTPGPQVAPGASAAVPGGAPPSGAVPTAVQTTGVATTGTPMPGVAPRVTGVSANTITGTPAGNAAASPGNGAAPRSAQALQSANVPIKSEKLGTATPSADVKKAPTQAVPKGVGPAVDKGNANEVKH